MHRESRGRVQLRTGTPVDITTWSGRGGGHGGGGADAVLVSRCLSSSGARRMRERNPHPSTFSRIQELDTDRPPLIAGWNLARISGTRFARSRDDTSDTQRIRPAGRALQDCRHGTCRHGVLPCYYILTCVPGNGVSRRGTAPTPAGPHDRTSERTNYARPT